MAAERRGATQAPLDSSVSPFQELSTAVLVATRNRPENLRDALAGLCDAVPPDTQIIIVDQGDDDAGAHIVLAAADSDRRIVYVRSRRRGLSAARNEGAAAARADLLLFTDDDCLVEPGWVEAWRGAFAADPEVGIGFGSVRPPFPDRPGTKTPAFEPGPQARVCGSRLFRGELSGVGMGANMALRRSLWVALGGFDEALGAGTRFPGAEDLDAAYRVVKSGHKLAHVPAPPVIHLGAREGEEMSRLFVGYARAKGAMFAKLIRCLDAFALEVVARDILRQTGSALLAAIRGDHPLGIRSLGAYFQGGLQSLTLTVDRGHRVFACDDAGRAINLVGPAPTDGV